MDLIHETGRAATKPTTKPTTTRATTGKKKPTKKATLKARAAQAREAYKAKQEASRQAHRDEQRHTTAETHHGSAPKKQRRADTGSDVIAVLRRSGLALTTTEVYEDLQKAGWKYRGDKPLEAVRGCLNRLVKASTVAREQRNGDITFTIARVEHPDPAPHEQHDSDL